VSKLSPLLTAAEWFAEVQRGAAPRGVRSADAAHVETAQDGSLSYVMSTSTVDRPGDTIAQEGWVLEAYRKNPVLLFGHDYSQPPVGRVKSVAVEGGKLMGRAIEFTPKDLYPFGAMVGEMVRGGWMNACSVGFAPTKYAYNEKRGGLDFLEQELLELSVVPVPANSEALVGAKSAGVDLSPLVQLAEKRLDNDASAPTWLSGEDAARVWRSLSPRIISVRQHEAPSPAEQHAAELKALRAEVAALTKFVQEARAAAPVSTEPPSTQPQAKAVAPPAPPSAEAIAKAVHQEVQRRLAEALGRITE
jgi:HK97 family phage prohead protease